MPSSRSRWGRILFPVLFSLASVSEGSAQPARTEGWVFGLGSGTTAVYVNTLVSRTRGRIMANGVYGCWATLRASFMRQ